MHRLLSTSRLPASTIEKIISLTARESSSLSRSELFCALALVALAQSSTTTDISIEQLSASISNLALPKLSPPSPVLRGYTLPQDSSWDTERSVEDHSRPNGTSNGKTQGALDMEAEKEYWKKVEKIDISLISEKQGWFLQKYRIESDVGLILLKLGFRRQAD